MVGGATVDGATDSTYVMSDVTRDQNTHEVTCQATNPVGMNSVTHTLNVECKYGVFSNLVNEFKG